MALYAYPTPNAQLIAAHGLQAHFEGGFFAQTVAVSSGSAPSTPVEGPTRSSTPALGHSAAASETSTRPGTPTTPAPEHVSYGPGAFLERSTAPPPPPPATIDDIPDTDATQIYYLLTPDSWRGRMHMNLHATFHVHHAGRAAYTLIRPPTATSKVEVRHVVMGTDVAKGERTQLYVPGGWWKASEIPEDDLAAVAAGEADSERTGCLISEVVVPGWNPRQHQFIDLDKLRDMWQGEEGWEAYEKYIAPPAGCVYPDME